MNKRFIFLDINRTGTLNKHIKKTPSLILEVF
jgi:hypothetical protein